MMRFVEKEVWMADVPPSLNKVGSRGGHMIFHRHKKKWQDQIHWLLVDSRLSKGNEKLHVHAILRFPTKRSRDSGNFQALLEKATGDALVTGGWLAADTHDAFSFSIAFDPHRGPRRTTLQLSLPQARPCQVVQINSKGGLDGAA